MLDRYMGLETEYAVRRLGTNRFPLGNLFLFRTLMSAMKLHCDQVKGRDFSITGERYFVQNGGAFYYEALPTAIDGGLVEGVTPECTSPRELLVYQKAQERLLVDALRHAERALPQSSDEDCRFGLLKNCRDAYGHVHAAQENYEVDIARGWRLGLLRAGLVALAPAIVPVALLLWTITVIWIIPALLYTVVGSSVRARSPEQLSRTAEEVFWSVVQRMARPLVLLEISLWAPVTWALNRLFSMFAFREIRRNAMAFFVSRAIICGAGTLLADGRFVIAEKAGVIKRVLRLTNSPNDRPLIDTGNLFKRFMAPTTLRFRPFLDLLCRRQRLQLGFADANIAPTAEYLKLGMTSLVLDMAEAGWLSLAPQPRNAVGALGDLSADPSLTAQVDMKDGSRWNALRLQRWYLDRAIDYVAKSQTVSLEASRIVRLWAEVLAGLETNADSLFGRIDWVTKQSLIDRGRHSCDFNALKKIDLRYHELDDGYFEWLRAGGLVEDIVRDNEIDRAIKKPPRSKMARARSICVRRMAGDRLRGVLSWDSIKIDAHKRRTVRFSGGCG